MCLQYDFGLLCHRDESCVNEDSKLKTIISIAMVEVMLFDLNNSNPKSDLKQHSK